MIGTRWALADSYKVFIYGSILFCAGPGPDEITDTDCGLEPRAIDPHSVAGFNLYISRCGARRRINARAFFFSDADGLHLCRHEAMAREGGGVEKYVLMPPQRRLMLCRRCGRGDVGGHSQKFRVIFARQDFDKEGLNECKCFMTGQFLCPSP